MNSLEFHKSLSSHSALLSQIQWKNHLSLTPFMFQMKTVKNKPRVQSTCEQTLRWQPNLITPLKKNIASNKSYFVKPSKALTRESSPSQLGAMQF